MPLAPKGRRSYEEMKQEKQKDDIAVTHGRIPIENCEEWTCK
jgi:hypothetical protein